MFAKECASIHLHWTFFRHHVAHFQGLPTISPADCRGLNTSNRTFPSISQRLGLGQHMIHMISYHIISYHIISYHIISSTSYHQHQHQHHHTLSSHTHTFLRSLAGVCFKSFRLQVISVDSKNHGMYHVFGGCEEDDNTDDANES